MAEFSAARGHLDPFRVIMSRVVAYPGSQPAT